MIYQLVKKFLTILQELREKVARGNTILYMNDTAAAKGTSSVTHDNVIFALRKFTGGMGDEDEDQPDSGKTWMNYFLKPLESSHREGTFEVLKRNFNDGYKLKTRRRLVRTTNGIREDLLASEIPKEFSKYFA